MKNIIAYACICPAIQGGCRVLGAVGARAAREWMSVGLPPS